jgi:chemotaxis family two-component system sensor kinase Cph1
MPSGNVTLVMGDVAGHGLAVAAITAQLRHALRAYLLRDAGPAAALKALNTLITSLLPQELATVIVAELDPWTGSVSIASAGHPPALLLTPESASFVDAGRGAALGLFATSSYTQTQLTMISTDRLLLFTDGLIETRDTNLDEGLHRLITAAGAADRDIDRLLDEVLGAIRPTDADDVTLLAVAMQGAGDD